MKDKITLKKVIWSVIGFLVFALIIVPIGETLIYESRYKNPNIDLVQISNDDFEMNVNRFVASGRDGFVNVDIIKKNSAWKYAEIQVIDKDGYIIHREFVDLRDVSVGSKVNVEFAFNGEDAVALNIVGSDEVKEPITVVNTLKNKIKESKIYKKIDELFRKVVDKLSGGDSRFNIDAIKAKLAGIPNWLKSIFLQIRNFVFSVDPGLRAIILIIIGYVLL